MCSLAKDLQTFEMFTNLIKGFKEQGCSIVLLSSQIDDPWSTMINRFGVVDQGNFSLFAFGSNSII